MVEIFEYCDECFVNVFANVFINIFVFSYVIVFFSHNGGLRFRYFILALIFRIRDLIGNARILYTMQLADIVKDRWCNARILEIEEVKLN